MFNFSLDQKINIFKKSAEFLSYKTFPNCKIGEDLDISILKTTDLVYDGYSCGIYHSISIFEKYKIKILQVWSKYHSFLCMETVLNIGVKFLSDEGLFFFEIWNGEKVIYCLIVVLDEKNNVINDFYKKYPEEKELTGIKYCVIENPEINIL